MFNFFGLGMMEILILGIIGLIVIVAPAIVLIAVSAGSRPKPDLGTADEVMELRAEVKRLREEVAHLKEGGAKGASGAIASGEP